MDTRTPEQRRKIMQAVSGKNTGPELALRKLLRSKGYVFRLHDAKLPGRPDVVFPRHNKAIFVHGCFWHGHRCRKGRLPKSRPDFWKPKIANTRSRDRRVLKDLSALGWTHLVIWQCELKNEGQTRRKLQKFLGSPVTIKPLPKKSSRAR